MEDEIDAGEEVDGAEEDLPDTPPVVWVLKAKMKWVTPLMIMIQPKKRVMAIPEMRGRRMAKRPARMRRTLRAMDQLMALGASRGEGDGRGAHDESSKSGRWKGARLFERIPREGCVPVIMEKVWRNFGVVLAVRRFVVQKA